MAICKDCIHYKCCRIWESNEKYFENVDIYNCCAFIDKFKIIELPCKFLQKCFVIPTIENNLSDITEMKCIGFSLSHDSYNANLITDKNKLYQPCFGAFGKTVFLTREEAEKALERSRGNA